MGFRENLKNELSYSGMLVKELSEKSGVKKHTLDKYLRDECSKPSADFAVRIAGALGVTVEYLVTGEDTDKQKLASIAPETRLLIQAMEGLDDADRKIVLNMIASLKERENIVKKPVICGL
jgi:transcriptional regulator with XRE-family HTH domain